MGRRTNEHGDLIDSVEDVDTSPSPRWLMLEELYKEAREEVIVGRPVMELPPNQVSCDAKGRVFVDLRAVIDQLQIFIAKGD